MPRASAGSRGTPARSYIRAPKWRLAHLAAIAGILHATLPAAECDKSDGRIGAPVRVADVVGGHVHPSLAVTQAGDVLVVFIRTPLAALLDPSGASKVNMMHGEDAVR